MVKGVRAAYMVGALAVGLLGSTSIRAQDSFASDGKYDFSFGRNDNIFYFFNYQVEGTFELKDFNISDFQGSVTYNGSTSDIYTAGSFGQFNGVSADLFVFNDSDYRRFQFSGQLQHVGNTYQYSNRNGQRVLIALAGSSPGEGSSPSSGGAPLPEVGTLLGCLIVAGTVALIRRRHRTLTELEAVAA